MEKKIIDYSVLAIGFVEGMIKEDKNSKEQLENT
jgi:hypothetical protein